MYSNSEYKDWLDKYEVARSNMSLAKSKSGILIEVAAQHPLVDGKYPNEEFSKRLLLAIDLYNTFKLKEECVKIYVPGSLHQEAGTVDTISLSVAGKRFLIENGIPESDIFSNDANEKYKGTNGVYNSSDECYVASQLFCDLNFSQLHCVCSSAQMFRKMLSYIYFGYVPYMHTVSCDEMYHSYIKELFEDIPKFMEDKHGLQGNSEEGNRLRSIRNPGYSESVVEK